MRRPLRRLAVALCVLALAVPVVAGAAGGPTPTTVGFDVSYPQCNGSLPNGPGFGVVGVNDGHAFSVNPCLAHELVWAQDAQDTPPSFYVNTQSPGPAGTGAWPSSQSSPESCDGSNSIGCAYDYGWNAARTSFAAVLTAETKDGAASPRTAAATARWWLDVETGNAWETTEGIYPRNNATETYDRSSLLGMIAYLNSVGVNQVGIYSTHQQWVAIVGDPSDFSGIPVWLPGLAATLDAATSACTTASFTGGRVAMIQYPSSGIDGDYSCGLLEAPVTLAVATAATSGFSQQLVATNNTGAVTFDQAAGQPQLYVSTTGLLTTSGALASGTYVASGTTSDAAGDTGTFEVTLAVGELTQSSPTTATVKVSGSAAFTTQITMNGASPSSPPIFAQTAGQPHLLVSTTGVVTTGGALSAGTYSATGTVSDGLGDNGTFTFSLTVGHLVQRHPTTGTVAEGGAATYSVQLDTGANLGPVTYVQTTGQPSLLVSSSGLVTTAGALAPGSYSTSGTTNDTTGDVGAFIFTLQVTASATTTTTIPTTTTTAPPPTTTTTAPASPRAVAVIGRAVAGQTVTLTVSGSGFYGRPVVTSHAGTTAVVARDTGRLLVLHVRVRRGSRNGVFIFTLTFSHGQRCRVRYVQG